MSGTQNEVTPETATPIPASTSYGALAEATARMLTTRYVLALLASAVVAGLGQVLVQVSLSAQAHDARIINIAGRQRMLSQQMVKDVLAIDHVAAAEAEELRQGIRVELTNWTRIHRGLQIGDATLGLPGGNTRTVMLRWEALEPAFTDLHRELTAALTGQPQDLAALLASQRRFLVGMEAVVNQLDAESSQRVHWLRWIEAGLYLLLVLILAIEALLVFRPAIHRLRASLIARERAERRAIAHEVEEAAGRLQRRIGQDLHDGLGQELTGVSFQAKALERRLAGQPEAQSAAEIVAQVQVCIATTRNLARLLHPPSAEVEYLPSALRELAETTARVYAITCTCDWDDDLSLPDIQDAGETPPGVHLFRIAQEAINNAARHGRAKSVLLTGRATSSRAFLSIDDDGNGFDVASHADGMGLRTMAHRCAAMGATLSINRRMNGGMRVEVTWPMTPPA